MLLIDSTGYLKLRNKGDDIVITKKRLLIATLILVGAVLIIMLYKFSINNEELLVPLKSLEELDESLSDGKLRKLNNNYYDVLDDYDFNESKFLYQDSTFSYDNNIFTGRFVYDSYTYEFTINTKNNDVNIKEISRRQIDIEEAEANNG